MAQPRRAPTVLPEDQVRFPAPTRQLTAVCNTSSKASDVVSGLGMTVLLTEQGQPDDRQGDLGTKI